MEIACSNQMPKGLWSCDEKLLEGECNAFFSMCIQTTFSKLTQRPSFQEIVAKLTTVMGSLAAENTSASSLE